MVALIKVLYKLWVHRILKKYQFYEKVTHKNDEVEKDNKTEGERERVEREVKFRVKYIKTKENRKTLISGRWRQLHDRESFP